MQQRLVAMACEGAMGAVMEALRMHIVTRTHTHAGGALVSTMNHTHYWNLAAFNGGQIDL